MSEEKKVESVGPVEQVKCPQCHSTVRRIRRIIHDLYYHETFGPCRLDSWHAAQVESTPSPAQEPAELSQSAMDAAANIEKEYGNCCGDVVNIYADDLAAELDKYAASQKELELHRREFRRIGELVGHRPIDARPLLVAVHKVVAEKEAAEHSLSEVTTKLDRIEKALRNVIDSAVTDADTCSICLRDVSKHSDGCAIQLAESALSGEESH